MFPKIPRFDLSLNFFDLFETFKNSTFKKVQDERQTILEYQKAVSKYLGSDSAYVVPSARLGLYLILKSMGIGKGDEVLLPAWTYFAVPSILVFCGIKPVFIDIDPRNCNMDIEGIEKAITNKTKAIIVTHLYGLPMDMERISEIAIKHGIQVIEDCAQSFGANYGEKKTGSFGKASFYSFGLTKNYSTINGGLIAFNDPDTPKHIDNELKSFEPRKKFGLLKDIVKGFIMKSGTNPFIYSLSAYLWIRLYQQLFKSDIVDIVFDEKPFAINSISPASYKSNLNYAQAELGFSLLKVVDKANMLRHTNGLKLSMLLEKLDKIKIVNNPVKSYNIYLSFPIQYREPFKLKAFLIKKGIDSTSGFIRNNPTLYLFKDYYRECPNAERLEKEILHLPIYSSLSDDQIMFIADSVKEFFI
jgi:perosamine synthetase